MNKLPVLSELVNFGKNELLVNFEHTLFVCVQHLLSTTVTFFDSLIKLGAKPGNIYILGKHYSQSLVATHELLQLGIHLEPISPQLKMGEFAHTFVQDIKALWQSALHNIDKKQISSIIVLDDGGHCLAVTPYSHISNYQVIGIEQTTAGLANPTINKLPFPIIEVASAAAKQKLESIFIANAISKKVSYYLPKNKNQTVGIVGVGAIGQAVINKLKILSCKIIAHDLYQTKIDNHSSIIKIQTIKELIQQADTIFGCTGTDIFNGLEFNQIINKNKLFISCSSEDKEFLSLLKYIQASKKRTLKYNPLDNIQFMINDKHTIKILRGGFPINFTHFKEMEPPEDIQLTRGLLLSALIQANLYINNVNKQFLRVMLHPILQHIVVKIWNEHSPRTEESELIKNFYDLNWIANNSGGTYQELPRFLVGNTKNELLRKIFIESEHKPNIKRFLLEIETTNG